MSDIAIVEPMTRDEALDCLRAIKDRLREARQKALELYQREGWKALGYDSFKACAEAEFGNSFQHLYRLKDAALIEKALRESPAGELLPANVPERHLRVLKAALETPEDRSDAYIRAQDAAKAEGTAVTERHVQKGVEVVKAKQAASRYAVIGHMVAMGEVTAFEGAAMSQHIDKLKPKIRGDVMQVIARHGVSCPDLVPALGEMFDRNPENPSKTLATILQTGHVAGVPLRKATMTDLNRARQEASYEHAAEQIEQQRAAGKTVIEPIVINVYKGDPLKTFRALKKALPAADLIALQRLITDKL